MLRQKLSTPLIILLIIASFGLHKLVYELLNSKTNSFIIQKIIINGTILSHDIYFDQILTSATNSVQGNLTLLDIQKLKYNLEQLDLIKQATIQRDLPHTLNINIIEREPVAILKTKQTNYTVDTEGVILALIPNIAIPTLNIEYGLAMNGQQIADDFLLQILPLLISKASKNIQEIRIDKNRKIFFRLHNIKSEFAIDNNLINDKYILKAQEIGKTLTNQQIKTPKIIDIYSYENRSIGFY